jgi:hypothetical protein
MKAAPVLGSLSLAFLFANPQVLIFAVLEAADKIFAVDHDVKLCENSRTSEIFIHVKHDRM